MNKLDYLGIIGTICFIVGTVSYNVYSRLIGEIFVGLFFLLTLAFALIHIYINKEETEDDKDEEKN